MTSGGNLDFRPGAEMQWEILETEPAFKMIISAAPDAGGPPLHVHPKSEESYEVLEGSVEVFSEGKWRVLGEGQKAAVPAGVAHTVRGHGEDIARVVNVHTPALNYESFFREWHRLVSSGAVKLPPKDPRSLLRLGVLFSAYPDEQRIVRPPQALFLLLGFIGRRLGYGHDRQRER